MRRGFVLAVAFLASAACMIWSGVSAQSRTRTLTGPLLYTSAPQYDGQAWLRGGERFPAGARLMVRQGGTSRIFAPEFAAAADANVSFDGAKVLFAGKRNPEDAWQIWEVPVGGGDAKRITTCAADCVRPFYLPGGRIVYAAKEHARFMLQTAALDGASPVRLTYSPGNALPTDVLRDGRILFEAEYPLGDGQSPEIYTVYSDGSGVESYRCDHGTRRQAGKQSANGDIVLASEHGLGRFTSAVAHELDLSAPPGEFPGDVVELASSEYLVSWRSDAKARYSLQTWNRKTGSLEALVAANDADLVQPAFTAPRPVPNQHPSGLHDWSYANLLCLSAYTSKYKFAPGSVAAVKLYTTDERGQAKPLGTSSVEQDGSFYLQVPGDKPLQIELLDRQGKTLQREQGWWWARKGEQRICVGCHAGPERAPENAVPQVLVKSIKPAVMQ